MATQALAGSEGRATRARFVATICAGSFLLFLVQPMIARMALPRLGGAPAVWNSAMLVYQALLLGGYAWAHWLGRFGPRKQAMIHLGLFAMAALMLPIGLSAANPPADASPVFWVPWLLISSIGPLFFVVSAQAPLMQRWFALSDGGDPYPLYAASNLGSFGGLVAYPLIVEPLLPLAEQSWLWTAGYVLLFALVGWCGMLLRDVPPVQAAVISSPAPARARFLYWVLLAAVPSGLMLSTTLHLTTDIVAMPLLWVIPLGLYLISFSVAFADKRRWATLIVRITPLVLVIGGATTFIDTTRMPYLYGFIGLAMLFCVAVSLHAAMYDSRPDPAHLTTFYLAMSVGGVLGGLFCALLAPLVFNWGYEHPVLIVAAALLVAQRPLLARRLPPRALRWLPLVALGASMLANGFVTSGVPTPLFVAALLITLAIAIAMIGHRVAFGFTLMCVMLFEGGWYRLHVSAQPGAMTRSYFGIYTIQDAQTGSRNLVHGTTVHGVQNRGSVARETMHTSYYAPRSGIGLAMAAAPALFGPSARIGVVGLGAGTLACYAKPGQSWHFYEIDPAIAAIARDPKRFTFLSRCLPGVDVRIGDARLVLAREPRASLDLLAIDAFSSDAVPMHLLTREAFQTYRNRLRPGGLLMVHISNRYLDLEPVLAAAARDGWVTAARDYTASDAERQSNYSSSLWVAFAPDKATLAALEAANPGEPWRQVKARAGFAPWTDDHASILSVIKPYKRH